MSGRRLAGERTQVRPATVDDAAAVSRILNEIVSGGRHSVLDRTFSVSEERAFIADFPARGVFHVAVLPGEGIVGFQALEPYLPDMAAFAHVATMGTWVAAPRRRLGVGRVLCAATFPAARRNGFEKIFTDVRADNDESLAFHRSLGFREVGRALGQARYAGVLVDIVYIERDLRDVLDEPAGGGG
jgi:L-amino acid N-acyltransferase YncA